MNYPTEAQIDRAADALATAHAEGNFRPGDDLWAMTDEQRRQQFRARATDMLVILLNQESVLNG